MAVGPVHVPAAPARADLRGGVPRRSLALPGEPGAGASPEEHAGAGGARARAGRLRRTARDPDRPGSTVHGVAWLDGVRGGAAPQRHRAREEPPAPPADLRQDRAVLEDAVGGAALAHGVRRLCRLRAAGGAVRAVLQLPATAPGARRTHARRSVLPGGLDRAQRGRVDGGGERAAAGARAAGAAAVLPGRPARRTRPRDQRERYRAQGAHRRRGDHHPPVPGEQP